MDRECNDQNPKLIHYHGLHCLPKIRKSFLVSFFKLFFLVESLSTECFQLSCDHNPSDKEND